MPVQMIELEEVQMVETSDESLEAMKAAVGGMYQEQCGGSFTIPYCK